MPSKACWINPPPKKNILPIKVQTTKILQIASFRIGILALSLFSGAGCMISKMRQWELSSRNLAVASFRALKVSKWWTLSFILIPGNEEKCGGVKSGLYDYWCSVTTPRFAKHSVTMKAVWDVALSWWKCRVSYLSNLR